MQSNKELQEGAQSPSKQIDTHAVDGAIYTALKLNATIRIHSKDASLVGLR